MCYFEEPRPTAPDVVAQIDLVVGGASVDLRTAVKPYRKTLLGVARGMLSQFAPDNVEIDPVEFNGFFGSVFDLWADEARKVVTL